MVVNGGCYCFLFEKKTVKRSVQCHVLAQSPSDLHTNDKYPVTLRTALDSCKNVSLSVLFVSNGNSYTVSTQSDVCVYKHNFFTSAEAWSGKINLKKWTAANAERKGFASPGLRSLILRRHLEQKKLKRWQYIYPKMGGSTYR